MGLYQRLTSNDSSKISTHRFGAALREWAGGGVTRQQVIDAFALGGDDITQLDAIASAYGALPTTTTTQTLTKAAYLDRMEDVFILCETGDYDETKAKSRLGF